MNKVFLGLLLLTLAGCATSAHYVNYTVERFAPKPADYAVNIYPQSQVLPANHPYYVIGVVSIEGFASYGVTPELLAVKAQQYARKKGADAIINASTQVFHYWGGDAMLRFKGDLIVYK